MAILARMYLYETGLSVMPRITLNDAYFYMLFHQQTKLFICMLLINSYCWCVASSANLSKGVATKKI